eukprot:EG_transcript_10653
MKPPAPSEPLLEADPLEPGTRKRLSSYGGYIRSGSHGWGSHYAHDAVRASSMSGVSPDAGHVPPGKASTAATMFNVINLYVGLGLLAQAYAVQRGGWVTLAFMGLCGMMCAYTGRLVVKCFSVMDLKAYEDKGGATWSNLADFLLGRWGRWLVSVLTVTEFFGAGCMALLMTWQNAHALFPGVPFRHLALGLTGCVLPSLLLESFGDLALFSLLGACAKFLTAALPVVIYLTWSDEWRQGHLPEYDTVNHETLPMALGVIMLAYSAHACLPTIYGSMHRPQDFPTMVNVAFFAMFAMYAVMGGFGYLVFGKGCSPLITQDAFNAATQPWQRVLCTVVMGLVLWATYSTTVPVVAVLTDFVSAFHPGSARVGVRGMRILVCVLLAFVAYPTRNYLGYLMSGVGVVSLMITLLVPLLFNHCLFRAGMSRCEAVLSVALIGLCLALTALIAYNSAYELLDSLGLLAGPPGVPPAP